MNIPNPHLPCGWNTPRLREAAKAILLTAIWIALLRYWAIP